eukprot:TRINITY_DN13257_c0_g1_i1.p1 TRINITY_DN13257_c0_g1~~TRINITY_DN13257_c0_g1_i1.p1  ORF type:complete len:246 (+),score=-32.41 TRINITY_DN13257_c0_g1_i1:75-740(+)
MATVFTLENHCGETIWPGILTGGGGAPVAGGGLSLPAGSSSQVTVPGSWSGRFWGRTGCNFDGSGAGTCSTGDCGQGLQCGSAGGAPPVTLAEFTVGGDKDFYDVSLVDGYNVPVGISVTGGTGDCKSVGCVADLRKSCPAALTSVDSHGTVVACKSACEAFGEPHYCCTGAFSTPQTCSPNEYSETFKAACPSAYSYAYDDATSTFTCSSPASYTVTFCP